MMKNFLVLVLVLLGAVPAYANLFNWKGVYRVEHNSFANLNLGVLDSGKTVYTLQHLVLQPTLVVKDGISLNGRFHIFNCNPGVGCVNDANQLGQFFGNGGGGGSFFDSNVLSQTQKLEFIKVGDFYATFSHRYGTIRAGRIPIHFGLGITHNKGDGLFDHWYDSRDMVSYETNFGNLNVLFGYGTFSEGQANLPGDDLKEYNIKVGYTSLEKGIETGFYYQSRGGSTAADDLPPGEIGDGKSDEHSVNSKYWNIYAKKTQKKFEWAFEASFHRGTSNLTAGTNLIDFKGFGAIGEVRFKPKSTSAFKYQMKMGVVSGDNPETTGIYEGYFVDRNYDVGYILFNQPLGKEDALGTNPLYPKSTGENGGPKESRRTEFFDTETLTNTYFLAPHVEFRWKRQWRVEASFLAAFVYTDRLNKGSSLGYELDLTLKYQPTSSFEWVLKGGYLFAGSALGGKTNPWGLGTHLAMSF